ncbi:hypothetical protein IF2G_00552 [Cordyceps javanica]|nr:hypothetical protein IF2G_00552 [Cordyceps javanica]
MLGSGRGLATEINSRNSDTRGTLPISTSKATFCKAQDCPAAPVESGEGDLAATEGICLAKLQKHARRRPRR